jgi:hypothetical protein
MRSGLEMMSSKRGYSGIIWGAKGNDILKEGLFRHHMGRGLEMMYSKRGYSGII